MTGFLYLTNMERRNVARLWRELRKSIRVCQREGCYGSASILRVELNKLEFAIKSR